jgi:hypothetical protein
MKMIVQWCIGSVVALAGLMESAAAAELRVVDSAGLVRAVKVIRDTGQVVVTVRAIGDAKVQGECSATNVDGLAAEQKAPVSSQGECVFSNLPGGTWQIATPQGTSWKARING